MAEIRYIVFDVGGVLVELTGAPCLMEWTGSRYPSEQRLFEAWILSPAVQHYECGHCSTREFALAIVDELALPVSADDFIEAFSRWPNGLFDGVKPLLDEVRQQHPIACLSNTNELHWPNQIDADYLHSIFDRSYLSYKMGMVKPHPEIFSVVVDEIGLPPGEILYLDDNRINVEAAENAGMVAHVARGVDGVRRVLQESGCLT